MRLLFIGDVVGSPGRECLRRLLPEIKTRHRVGLVVANGENAAGGAGITEKVYAELREIGVDVVTGGNHSWDQKDVFNFIDREPRLLRPANYPDHATPGNGTVIVPCGPYNTAVINLAGRVFMHTLDCPFRAADRELKILGGRADVVIVDFHAEATSEKQALGWYLDGRVSAVFGTHSHVQTADERLLSRGTAYISDVGMVGLYDSILGVDCHGPLQRFLTKLPHKLTISSTGRTFLNAVIVEVNPENGMALSIERIIKIN